MLHLNQPNLNEVKQGHVVEMSVCVVGFSMSDGVITLVISTYRPPRPKRPSVPELQ